MDLGSCHSTYRTWKAGHHPPYPRPTYCHLVLTTLFVISTFPLILSVPLPFSSTTPPTLLMELRFVQAPKYLTSPSESLATNNEYSNPCAITLSPSSFPLFVYAHLCLIFIKLAHCPSQTDLTMQDHQFLFNTIIPPSTFTHRSCLKRCKLLPSTLAAHTLRTHMSRCSSYCPLFCERECSNSIISM